MNRGPRYAMALRQTRHGSYGPCHSRANLEYCRVCSTMVGHGQGPVRPRRIQADNAANKSPHTAYACPPQAEFPARHRRNQRRPV